MHNNGEMDVFCTLCNRDIVAHPADCQFDDHVTDAIPLPNTDWEAEWNASASVWKNRLRLYPEDIVARISEHWYKHPYPSDDQQHLVIGILCFLFISGTIGNVGVIYMFFTFRSLRKSSNMFLVNLAVSDFLMLFVMPLTAVNSYKGGPALGVEGCNAMGIIGGAAGTVSITVIAVIAAERYWGVTRQTRGNVLIAPWPPHSLRCSSRIVIIVGLWIYGSSFSLVPLFVSDNSGIRYVPEGYMTTCGFDLMSTDPYNRAYILIYWIGAYLMPLVVIGFCYTSVVRYVSTNCPDWRVQIIRSGQVYRQHEQNQGFRYRRRNELRIIRATVPLVISWIITWTPYSIIAIMSVMGYSHLISPTMSMIPALIAKTSSTVNPILYVAKHRAARSEMARKSAFFRLFFKPRQRQTVIFRPARLSSAAQERPTCLATDVADSSSRKAQTSH